MASAETLRHRHLRAFTLKWSFQPLSLPPTYLVVRILKPLSFSLGLFLSLHLVHYDFSVYVRKNKKQQQQKLLLQKVTFSHNMSQIPFLGYTMTHKKREPQDVRRKDGAWPEVREFSPWNIVFTVTALGEKNDLALQMEAEREERWQIVSRCRRLWAWMSPTPSYVRVCFAHVSRKLTH